MRRRRGDGGEQLLAITEVPSGPVPPQVPPAAPRYRWSSWALPVLLAVAVVAALGVAARGALLTVRGTVRTGGPPQSELGLRHTEVVRLLPAAGGSWAPAAVALAVAGAALLVGVVLLTGPAGPGADGRHARAAGLLAAVPMPVVTVLITVAVLRVRHDRLAHPARVPGGRVFADSAVPGPGLWALPVLVCLAAALPAVRWWRAGHRGSRIVTRRLASSAATRSPR